MRKKKMKDGRDKGRKEEQENKHKKVKLKTQKIRSLETGTKSSRMVETIKNNNDDKINNHLTTFYSASLTGSSTQETLI